MANENKCENLECESYENGYCWGYGLPVKDVKNCIEQEESEEE